MPPEVTDDPLHTMTVERVMRPDGRYLIYYDWPAADEEHIVEDQGGERADV